MPEPHKHSIGVPWAQTGHRLVSRRRAGRRQDRARDLLARLSSCRRGSFGKVKIFI